jgi:hypothetical protein
MRRIVDSPVQSGIYLEEMQGVITTPILKPDGQNVMTSITTLVRASVYVNHTNRSWDGDPDIMHVVIPNAYYEVKRATLFEPTCYAVSVVIQTESLGFHGSADFDTTQVPSLPSVELKYDTEQVPYVLSDGSSEFELLELIIVPNEPPILQNAYGRWPTPATVKGTFACRSFASGSSSLRVGYKYVSPINTATPLVSGSAVVANYRVYAGLRFAIEEEPSAFQLLIDAKAPNESPVFTGNVSLPAATAISLDSISLSTILNAIFPIGSIMPFGGQTAPQGFFACDGTLLDRTAYPQLFAAIGPYWGFTNSGNFRVPDL